MQIGKHGWHGSCQTAAKYAEQDSVVNMVEV
jgi:hypothetical protein